MKNQINIRFTLLLLITTLLGFWRVLTATMDHSEWTTFSPLGAMAMFGGAYFVKKRSSYLFPILILLISDIVLMQTLYAPFRSGLLYEGWYWTYGSFALMVLVGDYIKNKVSVRNFLVGCLASGLIHFVLSNLGVWLSGGTNLMTGLPYTRDLSGIMACYIAAIPYFKTLLMGNLIYGTILFGGFELAQSRFSSLKIKSIYS
ncbi:MAG: hypothetical protein JXR03_10025 [Cyclobacteriaceae bacterium]